MPAARRGYRCSACGGTAPAYSGRCTSCQSWNTLEPFLESSSGRSRSRGEAAHAAASTLLLPDVPDDAGDRHLTRIPELDRVLGGGLVAGSLVLLGGEPGIGKSTLVLQAAASLADAGVAVAYVCGEESPRQVRLRAGRLDVAEAPVALVSDTSLDSALIAAERLGARVVVIDSVQAVSVDGVDARAGGPAQLAEAGARLVAWAKTTGVATILTGHVTKSGDIAGPRLLEHLVDAVLYFEGAEAGALRVLRAVKNRFGATDEVGVFEMTGAGLRSVDNPSAAFLAADDLAASGCAATAVVEGARPLAVEVQALAVPSYLATPRRIASGFEASRLHLLLAVLARRGGLSPASLDIVATVSGGLRLRDPAADLAILAALASAIRDVPLAPGTAFLGEVALSGAIRPVQGPTRRLAELARLGFSRCLLPPGTHSAPGIAAVHVPDVRSALSVAFAPAAV